ncbi:hypothetical protein CLV63_14114 [Murinocardiopsis flavida]|uniref:FtsK domain-containing protein n=1 Tax=Murinocardiopsis flavida TaxID=645275 RepID=A0A2P8CDI1_9ACTN|nr:hypothetical protein [Murinocardiopsis flavida]PSK83048.1 hypothetical protein CLV63_14114 [Murinocardiopsis flavida]
MAKTAKTAPTTRAPSAAQLAQAVETLEAARTAEERDKKRKRWTSEGLIGKGWQRLAHPPRGGLRDLYRHVLTPWYWAVPAAAAIAAQEGITTANDLGSLTSLGVVAAGSTATAAAAPAWLRTKHGRTRHPHAAAWAEREPAHTRTAAAVAAAGAIGAHALGLGVGWDADTLALAGTAGFGAVAAASARYWQFHRHHTRVLNPRAKAKRGIRTEAAPEAADPAELERRLIERWPKYVAASNAVLPGSELSGITRTDYGATAMLHLKPGAQEKATVLGAMGRIATALKLSASALAVEDVQPENGEEPDASVLRLRVVSQATSSRPVCLDDGRPRFFIERGEVFVRLGTYIDGQGEAVWKLYDKDSMWGGFFSGKTGSGKTTLIEALVMGAFEHGQTVVLYAKPRKGPSPRIAAHAHWVVEADAASRSALIDGVIRLMEIRGLINELNETSEFHPSPEFPGVMVVVDEFHEAAAQIEAAGPGRLNRIAREGRSLGAVLVGASQGFGLEGFVQDDAIRQNMTATNAISMKLSATQAGIFKREMGLAVNPGDLPDPQAAARNKGLAFSLGGREVPFRGAWAPEEESDALMAAARRSAAVLDADSAGALDQGSRGAYTRRDRRKAGRRAEIEKTLARMRTQTGMGSAEAARAHAREGGRPVPPALPERVVVDLAAHRREAEAAARTPAETGVLEVLQARGPVGTQVLREELAGREGCGKEAVDKALRTLAEAGAIAKAGESRKDPWRLL